MKVGAFERDGKGCISFGDMKIEAIVNIPLLTRKHAFTNLNHSVGTTKFALNTYRGFYRNTSSTSYSSAADVRYIGEVN